MLRAHRPNRSFLRGAKGKSCQMPQLGRGICLIKPALQLVNAWMRKIRMVYRAMPVYSLLPFSGKKMDAIRVGVFVSHFPFIFIFESYFATPDASPCPGVPHKLG